MPAGGLLLRFFPRTHSGDWVAALQASASRAPFGLRVSGAPRGACQTIGTDARSSPFSFEPARARAIVDWPFRQEDNLL